MSDLQKRFEAQRQQLLKTVPKNSERVIPAHAAKAIQAGADFLDKLDAQKRSKIVEPPHFEDSLRAGVAMIDRFTAEKAAKEAEQLAEAKGNDKKPPSAM